MGVGDPFIRSSLDPKINNVTSTKQTVDSSSGLLVLAGDDSTRFYVHNFLPLTGITGTRATLTTTADTYVDSANPTKSFGTSTTAWVDNSPVNTGYLKFDLTPYAGKTITGAILKLRTTSGTTSGSGGTTTVRQVSDDTWTEASLTYANRKPLGTTILGSLVAPASASKDYSLSLEPGAVQTDIGSTLSLGLTTTSSDGLGLATREAAPAGAATLQLTFTVARALPTAPAHGGPPMRSRTASLVAVSAVTLSSMTALAGLGPIAAATPVGAREIAAVSAATAPGAAPVPAAVMTRQSEGLCRTVGFTPRSVVVGATPAVVTFKVTASACTLRHWELSLGPYDYYTYTQSPRAAIGPLRNAEAGQRDVVVDTCNSEFDCSTTSFPKGFTLKRRTTWQTGSFNATPEPVRKGRPVSLQGRLLVVNWDARRYVGFTKRLVAVEFRTPTGSYTKVATAVTDATGWVRTTVPASRTGVWRLRYGGNTVAGPATVAGDSVQVVP